MALAHEGNTFRKNWLTLICTNKYPLKIDITDSHNRLCSGSGDSYTSLSARKFHFVFPQLEFLLRCRHPVCDQALACELSSPVASEHFVCEMQNSPLWYFEEVCSALWITFLGCFSRLFGSLWSRVNTSILGRWKSCKSQCKYSPVIEVEHSCHTDSVLVCIHAHRWLGRCKSCTCLFGGCACDLLNFEN